MDKIILVTKDLDYWADKEQLLIEGIKYYMEGSETVTIQSTIEFMVKFYNYTGLNEGVTYEDILIKGWNAFSIDSVKKEVIQELNLSNEEDYKSIAGFIDNNYLGEVMDYLEYHLEYDVKNSLNKVILEANGFKYGIVGYSPWAPFIAYNKVNNNYIRSLWDGSGFYMLEVINSDGSHYDSLAGVYLEEEYTLKEAVNDQFGIEDFKVVKNNVTEYMELDGLELVEEVKHVSYSYIPLKEA